MTEKKQNVEFNVQELITLRLALIQHAATLNAKLAEEQDREKFDEVVEHINNVLALDDKLQKPLDVILGRLVERNN